MFAIVWLPVLVGPLDIDFIFGSLVGPMKESNLMWNIPLDDLGLRL